MARIAIPHNWDPRPYQMPAWRYMEGGGKRAVLVWHRRSGKDDFALNFTASASLQRVGNYWHMLPEYNQARKAIWDAINPHTGVRRIDQALPWEIVTSSNDQNMSRKLVNGSMWQAIGSDNYNALVGTPPIGVVFSEMALCRPEAWDYLRPILAENGGWAMFLSTPRGENHFYDMFKMAQGNPEWFAQVLTVDDTGAISPESVQAERDAGMSEAMIAQEFFCSFSSPLAGAIYAEEMAAVEDEGRITTVPHNPRLPLHTAWDLGRNLHMAVWAFQVLPSDDIAVIDCIGGHTGGIKKYCAHLRDRPYTWDGVDLVPHDAKVREIGSERTRIETMIAEGRRPRLVPLHHVADGIQATRLTLPNCWFDRERCRDGIQALRAYERSWDAKKRVYSPTPNPNWAAHWADAFRYLSMGWRSAPKEPPAKRAPIRGLNAMSLDELIRQDRMAKQREMYS